MRIFLPATLLATLSVTLPALPAFGQTLSATGGTEILRGDAPGLVVNGLKPGAIATVHLYRLAGKDLLAHAWGEFKADANGKIDVDHTAPLRGTYSGVDPLGLLWSGEANPLSDIGITTGRDVVVRVDGSSATLRLILTDGADRVTAKPVDLPNLNGYFARPKQVTGKLPAIVLLHGSEGGTPEAAKALAIRFAQLGYAAFAWNYFRWGAQPPMNSALVNIPVESFSTVRAWLQNEPDVETEQISIWGGSKGAEFALVAAANFNWLDRVVACVASNVVWEGFGRPKAPGEPYSSWSVGGKALPYITYDNYGESLEGKISAGAVHRRSFIKATEAERAAARIPIENSKAKILLLGATKDHFWPSGDMVARMKATRAVVYPDASHFICGTGAELQRIDPVKNPEGGDPSPDATAHAVAAAWAETRKFLKRD